MQKKLTLKELQAICLKKNDCIIMRNYRRISTRITMLIYKTGILPWQVTLISFALALVGAGLFLLGEYAYLVAGAIMLQLSFILDCVDGEIARINKSGSSFGAWLDTRFDYYSTACFIGAAALGQFFLLGNIAFLILAVPAIINFGMVTGGIGTKIAYVEKSRIKPMIGKKRYIGNRGLTVTIITLAALTNTIFYALFLFATVWALIWIKTIFEFYKIAKDRKPVKKATVRKSNN